MKPFDLIVIGAGASGLFAAATAEYNGHNVAIIDMGDTPGRKIAVSGGGRCNFTNIAVAANRYFGNNTNFVRGALARFSPNDMLIWMHQHNFTFTEKAPGQYFCSQGASAIVNALIKDISNCTTFFSTTVTDVDKSNDIFIVHTTKGDLTSKKLIVASGGTSFANLMVSDIGYKIAKKFGHKIIPIRPALCAIQTHAFSPTLSGISLPVSIHVNNEIIYDDMLFTHTGIGGPAVYRATVRNINRGISINIAPDTDIYEFLYEIKHKNGKKTLAGAISQKIPERVARWICGGKQSAKIADLCDTELRYIAKRINNIEIPLPDIKYHSLSSAEVVRGGIDTTDVSSKTMESKLCHGLYFTGEVLDITGDLGGFNLHWAWASGFTAGNAI